MIKANAEFMTEKYDHVMVVVVVVAVPHAIQMFGVCDTSTKHLQHSLSNTVLLGDCTIKKTVSQIESKQKCLLKGGRCVEGTEKLGTLILSSKHTLDITLSLIS